MSPDAELSRAELELLDLMEKNGIESFEALHREAEETVKAMQKYGCPMDYVLKDITTVSGKPQNLILWAQTVSDVMDEYYGAD